MTKEKLVILGHPNPDIDSIISGILMEHYINNYTNYQGEFIIPDTSLDKSTIDICKKYNIDYQSHQKEIPKERELVDYLLKNFAKELSTEEKAQKMNKSYDAVNQKLYQLVTEE